MAETSEQLPPDKASISEADPSLSQACDENMPKKTNDPSFASACWYQGVDLWQAIRDFAPDDIKSAVRREMKLEDARISGMQPTQVEGEPFDVIASMAAYGEMPPCHGEAIARAKKLLLENLTNGKLMALGYRQPQRAGDEPIQISAQELSEPIDWRRSWTLSEPKVGDIRILDRAKAEDIQSVAHEVKQSPGAGRPSIKSIVFEAWDILDSRGSINYADKHSVAIRQVQDLISSTLRPHLSPPSESVIRNYTRALFKEGRAKMQKSNLSDY